MNTKEAIERICARFDKWALDNEDMKAIQTLIPELKDSEDEKIRKWLIDYFDKVNDEVVKGDRLKIISYLEKQKDREAEIEKAYKTADKVQYEKGFNDGVASVKPAGWSEEERIRNGLIKYLQDDRDYQPCQDVSFYDEAISYLEKQKEQPTDAKLERVIKAARRVLNNWLDGTDCPDVSGDFAELEYAIREYDSEEKQKEQKPAEWNEEDENTRHDIIVRLESLSEYETQHLAKAYLQKEISWLKALRPQPHWKPSEEQIDALERAIIKMHTPNDIGILAELRDNLKKIL